MRRPTVVLLENVRNIAGPRHAHEWDVIIRSLRDLGYRVSSKPVVFSPHLLPPERGGRPQVRERVFILGTYVGKQAAQVDVEPAVPHAPSTAGRPTTGPCTRTCPSSRRARSPSGSRLNLTPRRDHLGRGLERLRRDARAGRRRRASGFPVWMDAFVHEADLVVEDGTPEWKANFLRKNAAFYTEHQELLEAGWSAGTTSRLPGLTPQVRVAGPGRRVARRDRHAPAAVGTPRQARDLRACAVAITQTSILGDRRRRLSPREAARLRGCPEWFDFGDQPDAATYKQMGNGVNVGAAYHVLREHVRDEAGCCQALPGPGRGGAGLRPTVPTPRSSATGTRTGRRCLLHPGP